MPVEEVMSTSLGWFERVPLAFLSASAFSRSFGGSGVAVPICATNFPAIKTSRNKAQENGIAARRPRYSGFLLCAGVLLLIVFVPTDLVWLYLQILVNSAQLFF